ncbi:MAG: hypothetical protein HYZ36_00800, partial [Pedosphaera parvula]|nr:hypothetical protein [Pedosphaera parvula]
MIGFVAAFRAEVRDVLVEISGERGERIEEAVFHRGYLGPAHFPAVLAIAGMGPVRARASAATLVERYRASLLIALGTCGGLSSALPSGTLIIPSAVRSVTSGACAGPVTPDARLQEKLMQAAASASARPVTGLLLSTERVVRTAQEKRGLADRFGG